MADQGEIQDLIQNIETQLNVAKRFSTLLLDSISVQRQQVEKYENGRREIETRVIKLFASFSATTKMMEELISKNTSLKESLANSKKNFESELSATKLTIEEMSQERLTLEEQWTKTRSELEQNFELEVGALHGEIEALRRKSRELASLNSKLHEERNDWVQSTKIKALPPNDIRLLSETLKSIWHLTWQPAITSDLFQVSPDIVVQIFDNLISIYPQVATKSGAKYLSSQPSSASNLQTSIEIVPDHSCSTSMLGILVNIASHPFGIDRLRALNKFQYLNFFSELLLHFSALQPDGNSDQDISICKELILCLFSNLAASSSLKSESNVFKEFFEFGWFQFATKFVVAENDTNLRKYMIKITKVLIEAFPWSVYEGGKAGSKDSKQEAIFNSKFDAVFEEISSLATVLYRDPSLKLMGMEIMATMQKVLPQED